jgi:hypothetical protein
MCKPVLRIEDKGLCRRKHRSLRHVSELVVSTKIHSQLGKVTGSVFSVHWVDWNTGEYGHFT